MAAKLLVEKRPPRNPQDNDSQGEHQASAAAGGKQLLENTLQQKTSTSKNTVIYKFSQFIRN
jgi:hypothetical protein